jgi:hypothetical protein
LKEFVTSAACVIKEITKERPASAQRPLLSADEKNAIDGLPVVEKRTNMDQQPDKDIAIALGPMPVTTLLIDGRLI